MTGGLKRVLFNPQTIGFFVDGRVKPEHDG
jgi:hypothetical protein